MNRRLAIALALLGAAVAAGGLAMWSLWGAPVWLENAMAWCM